jgi:hypothetical protein
MEDNSDVDSDGSTMTAVVFRIKWYTTTAVVFRIKWVKTMIVTMVITLTINGSIFKSSKCFLNYQYKCCQEETKLNSKTTVVVFDVVMYTHP